MAYITDHHGDWLLDAAADNDDDDVGRHFRGSYVMTILSYEIISIIMLTL